jgi:hypothetical protein
MRKLLYRLRRLRRPEWVDDQPLLDWFNDAKDRGLIGPDVTLSQILSPGMAELDRIAGIPPDH